MKDIPKDQKNEDIPVEPKKRRRHHQYQANPAKPIYSSYKSSEAEIELNKKIKKITGYTGY